MILNHQEIVHKIRRMAYQIYEANVNESEVVIAGIADNGYNLAELLKNEVEGIAPFKVKLCRVQMNKKSPIGQIDCDCALEQLQGQSLVLVDDVLHSGTALIYGVAYFLQVPLKQFKTAVLVDRNHKKYPVKADFKGISLSTSLNENVVVDFSPGRYSARLA
jgi:pyrimidine operon attenuation protein/uracil phosphoribosyltransferase